MSSRIRIPSAIELYLRLPPELSLTLITGTLACSPNWLAALLLSSGVAKQRDTSDIDTNSKSICLVLASWMRDAAYWKSETRRNAGLDFSKLIADGQLVFVDLLSANNSSGSDKVLTEADRRITEAITDLKQDSGRKVLLMLDNPDLLLATSAATAHQLNSLVLKLRSMVHSATITCSADLPLLSAVEPESTTTQLEAEAASFIIHQAHAARYVMSLRELETGSAKDVSGVLRITRGGNAQSLDGPEAGDREEMEALYIVQRDGNVRVFERGAVGG